MLRAADVLVYVKSATLIHDWWVTKRLIQSPSLKPAGWPREVACTAFGHLRPANGDRTPWRPAQASPGAHTLLLAVDLLDARAVAEAASAFMVREFQSAEPPVLPTAASDMTAQHPAWPRSRNRERREEPIPVQSTSARYNWA